MVTVCQCSVKLHAKVRKLLRRHNALWKGSQTLYFVLVSSTNEYIHLFIVNPEGSMIHQYCKKSLKNASSR